MKPDAKSRVAKSNQGNLLEIMESIQGEGLMVGSRQVFIRFTGCNIRCNYCDTPDSLVASPYCQVYSQPGQRDSFIQVPNPISSLSLAELVRDNFKTTWISYTGGEPLLWASLIRCSAEYLKPAGHKFLLETNGTLPEALGECLKFMDCISMDWKLPSATGKDYSEQHYRFLLQARKRSCYIKMVIAEDSQDQEVDEAFRIIASIDKSLPVVLQIASLQGLCRPSTLARMMDLQQQGLIRLEDVRILPQMHRLLGIC